jgi:DNA-binding transcriptional LysR family regulator
MNIELLRTFLEVERFRHFGHAAAELNLTQAAVSARIRQLEEILGIALFDRSRREVSVTPAGHRLIRQADMILANWRHARQDVAHGDAGQQLTVACSHRLWNVLMQDWLQRVRSRLPNLALIAETHAPDVLTRRLLDGILDFAVMLEPPQLEILQIQPVADVELVLVSTQPEASLAVALGPAYVYVDWGLAHAVEHRRLFPDAPEARVRVAEARMTMQTILSLGGSAYLPLTLVREEITTGRLHRVDGAPLIHRTAYAVFPVRTARAEFISDCLALF